MNFKDIPKGDNICRYCKPSTVDNERLMGGAFCMGEKEEYLSVNWIEYLGIQNLKAAADKVYCVLCNKQYGVKPTGRMAIIGVGMAISVGHDARKEIRIQHVPESDDCSHSGIFGYTYDDYRIAVALAKKAQSFKPSDSAVNL